MKNLIVAISKNNGIGINNSLPWRLPPDLSRFKQLTLNSNVVMGRSTFDSLPFNCGLPSRTNIVLTRNTSKLNERIDKTVIQSDTRIIVTHDLTLTNYLKGDVWFIGGSELYKKVLDENMVDNMYITRILNEYNCDRFIDINYENFKLIEKSKTLYFNDIGYSYEIWKRV